MTNGRSNSRRCRVWPRNASRSVRISGPRLLTPGTSVWLPPALSHDVRRFMPQTIPWIDRREQLLLIVWRKLNFVAADTANV